ncbi:riboflavin-binding protein-like [Dendropsophus ebraccatus]|uniref:riboflavin-binding protein-like n=1 Tax=Dendropsophus ebraccatus TaxID=150705 RepID=UPI003831ADF3
MKTPIILLTLTFLSAVYCHHKCLQGTHHKVAPGPELNMQECTLYSEASCCHANFTEKLSQSPVLQVDNFYWNRCGNLSRTCEDYTKKIECFYQCSPLAAHWGHPNFTAALQGVPLCQSFCDGWFNACRSDLVCVHNFITDWIIDKSGNHCKNDCIPYDQMYVNGKDLCQSAWGSSFVVSTSPCRCLDMTVTDRNVIKYILENEQSEESGEEEACKPRLQGPPSKTGPDQEEDN